MPRGQTALWEIEKFRRVLAEMLLLLRPKFDPSVFGGALPIPKLHEAFYRAEPGLCPKIAPPLSRNMVKLGLTREYVKLEGEPKPVSFVVWDEKLEAFLEREGVVVPKEVTLEALLQHEAEQDKDEAPESLSGAVLQEAESVGNKGQEKEKEGTVAHQNDIEMHQNAPQETYDQKMDRVLGYTAPETRDLDGYIKIGPYLPDPKTAEAQMCISTRVRPETAVQIERINALWNTTKYTTVRRILEMIDLPALFRHAVKEKIDELEKLKNG